MKKLLIPAIAAFSAFAVAIPVFADDFQFQPIIPTGSLPLPTGGSLCSYLNAVFNLSIVIAITLAVLMIVINGFTYMTSEAIGKKGAALAGIRSALGGLILILASYLLLYIINPQILSLSAFSVNGGALSGVCGTNDTSFNAAALSGDNSSGTTGTANSTISSLLNTAQGTAAAGTTNSSAGGAWSFTTTDGQTIRAPGEAECKYLLALRRYASATASGTVCTQQNAAAATAAQAPWCYDFTQNGESVSNCDFDGATAQSDCATARAANPTAITGCYLGTP